ncbi:hypothetical protein [Haloimpatiens massiliensis]|uniref:hypothetical protein n=1 Tax=Haloimpatiens massiliensis TaxID=1658110 RepID=UPI0011AEE8AC|nr:hypothetical protein [Haloimpatiens massiliensis]
MMKMKEKYTYKGYEIQFEYYQNRKLKYIAICQCEQEKVKKDDETFEGAKNQIIRYIDNIPNYRELYK